MLDWHFVRRAISRARVREGIIMEARRLMMAITTRSSTSVKLARRW
jgi:hypothetical protein